MAPQNHRIPFSICLILGASLALAACARDVPSAGGGASEAPPAALPTAAASAATQTADVPNEQRLRQVIRKAELSFDVTSPADALKRATQIAEHHGGFVANSSTSAVSESTQAESVSLTLRVPADHFTQVLSELRSLSRGANVEHIGSEDVSEECVDLDARLKTQRALEAQFLEILKRADKVEDALRVEREIATVRTEIERMEGRRRFLSREVALSTITLTLSKERPLVSSSWQDFREAARQGYASSIENGAGLVTFSMRAFGALLPIFLLLGVPSFLALRLLGRWRRKRALAAAQ